MAIRAIDHPAEEHTVPVRQYASLDPTLTVIGARG